MSRRSRRNHTPTFKARVALAAVRVQSIERTKQHSEKPAEFRTIIDTLYPYGRRVELFARGELPKQWEAWGAESREVVGV